MSHPSRCCTPLLVIALGLLAGCAVQRTLEIDTTPSGARIWVDGELQDRPTPVEIPFTHYGRFDVRVEKDGYHSVATELQVESEIDGYPVIDLPFELAGGSKRWRRVVPLQPLGSRATPEDVRVVLDRARAFQTRTRREVVEPGTPGRQAPPEILR